jgi:hypothetical protein
MHKQLWMERDGHDFGWYIEETGYWFVVESEDGYRGKFDTWESARSAVMILTDGECVPPVAIQEVEG